MVDYYLGKLSNSTYLFFLKCTLCLLKHVVMAETVVLHLRAPGHANSENFVPQTLLFPQIRQARNAKDLCPSGE